VIVVADTSVILNLCCVKQIDLLSKLFHEVVIPPEVGDEFRRLSGEVPRFSGMEIPSWIRQQRCAVIPESLRSEKLDAGETAALALALEIHAGAVLVDERRGHEVARQLGLTVIGLVSVLLRAKTSGLLPRLAPVLDSLQRDAQFWLSERLRLEVLRIADEVS
jgi:predicted nucleic acid-binding protein